MVVVPFLDGVDRVDDVLLGQVLDQLPVKLPELEEAALQTLVVQRVHLKTGFLSIL